MTESFVGMDVSKRRLEVAVKSADKPQRFHQANSTGGIRTVVSRLSRLMPVVVVRRPRVHRMNVVERGNHPSPRPQNTNQKRQKIDGRLEAGGPVGCWR